MRITAKNFIHLFRSDMAAPLHYLFKRKFAFRCNWLWQEPHRRILRNKLHGINLCKAPEQEHIRRLNLKNTAKEVEPQKLNVTKKAVICFWSLRLSNEVY